MKAYLTPEQRKENRRASYKKWALSHKRKPLTRAQRLRRNETATWANYGHTTWHLDHKKPISSFNLQDEGEMRSCFHYTNYQPLWAIDNMKKGAKILFFDTAQTNKTSADSSALEHAVSAE